MDAEFLRAAEAAAKRGEVPTLSAWVNDALRLKLEHDRRLRALATFVEAYEAEQGTITEDEIERAFRRARSRAVPMRALKGERFGRGRPRRGAA